MGSPIIKLRANIDKNFAKGKQLENGSFEAADKAVLVLFQPGGGAARIMGGGRKWG